MTKRNLESTFIHSFIQIVSKTKGYFRDEFHFKDIHYVHKAKLEMSFTPLFDVTIRCLG